MFRSQKSSPDAVEDSSQSFDGCDSIPAFDDLGKVSMKQCTPAERLKDNNDPITIWVRNKVVDDEKYDPTGEFRKLYAKIPRKRGQISEDRARELEGTIDWVRGRGLSLEDDEVVDGFEKAGLVPILLLARNRGHRMHRMP